MSSTIENIIAELEDYIAECKPSKISRNNIIVNRDEIEALLDELKSKTPEEIRKYQKIISNKDAILNDAKAKAQNMIDQAQVRTDQLISEHQIMQQAYAQANEIVMIATNQAQEILDKATMDANNIRQGAIEYTDGLLKSIENLLTHAVDTAQAKQTSFISSMQGYLDVVTQNRIELSPQDYAADAQADSNVKPLDVQQVKPKTAAPVIRKNDELKTDMT